MDDLILRALTAGCLVALFCGPMGCFVVWRRLAYFGDALSHSALLGVALSLALRLPVTLAVATTSALLALLLLRLRRGNQLADDTLLGILSHGALALGLVTIALFKPSSMNWMGYLFGDIIAINNTDLMLALALALLVIILLGLLWQPMVLISLDRDLAAVEGVPVAKLELLLMLLLALVIAVAIKIVGVLLITAMLIIPAAAARRLSASPGRMALMAAVLGIISVIGGTGGAFQWDLPTGPAIVVAALILFLLVTFITGPISRVRQHTG